MIENTAAFTNTQAHWIVVGGGQSGGEAVRAFRAGGFAGKITLIAEEPYPPYERPSLSKEVLVGLQPIEYTFMQDEDFYSNSNIVLKLNTQVKELNTQEKSLVCNNGETLSYDKLMITTGSRIRRLNVPGAELKGIHYLRSIEDALRLRSQLQSARRVLVVGGGFIALEVAAAARSLALEVTLITNTDRILDRALDEEVASIMHDVHLERGVDIRTDLSVEKYVGDVRVQEVVLTNGEILDVDLVVVGIGIIPNDDIAAQAGINTGNGIIVNQFGETSASDVYAAGDVTNHYNPMFEQTMRLENWYNAQEQAICVAGVMCGTREPYESVPWFWSDQYDINLQMTGIANDYDQAIERESDLTNQFSKFYLKEGVLVGVVAINRPKDIMMSKKLIAKRTRMCVQTLADPNIKLSKAVLTK
jgi:3-phenylpropionate/trans-cinnamate dioxygenase ferredoxin reductase component